MSMNAVTFSVNFYGTRILTALLGLVCCLLIGSSNAGAQKQKVHDLNYGAILFEFYQQKYFEALVEYEYTSELGGIRDHGEYPELLKGGISLSYGLDRKAKQIFSELITDNAPEEVQNRAWFYLAKMLYLRGEIGQSATNLMKVSGVMPQDIDQEYRYLAALVNVKLGHFDAAEEISRSFDKDSTYAPYLYFNLGVTFGKQNEISRAMDNLTKAIAYRDGSEEMQRLADRAHMAIAFLNAENQAFNDAYNEIGRVSSSGVYSNRALLGAGWAYVNSGDYHNALTSLMELQNRSMAIPEVQEAVLLVPHVYEKLNLPGRAAKGFIRAYDRYNQILVQLDTARETLKDADVLELFVRNLDQILGESDWFGTAPTVSLNSLSPFLLDLMSDHSFQSVLKELRDLYAIRNNLESWKRKKDEFSVILKARMKAPNESNRNRRVAEASEIQAGFIKKYAVLSEKASNLDDEEKERVLWQLNDVDYVIKTAATALSQLHNVSQEFTDNRGYSKRIKVLLKHLDKEIDKTNKLIDKIENVMLKLVKSELETHEERIKYYQVQAHLAKVRILDRSLSNIDDQLENESAEAEGSKSKSLIDKKENAVGGEHAS
jgi:tetratricopeptide (TPR) repeat protein